MPVLESLMDTVVKIARQKKSWLAIYALASQAFIADRRTDVGSGDYIPAIEKAVELGLLVRDGSSVKYKPQPRKKAKQEKLF